MKRKITVLVIEDKIGNYFLKELKNIFENTVEVEYFTPNMANKPYIYETDLILYTDPSIFIEMIEYIKCSAPTLMMKRTISKQSMEKLWELDGNKSAYVVNINSFMANETLATLYSLGIKNMKLYPYYNGVTNVKKVDYIITPNEFENMPNIDAEIIDIGNRLFDISTILDIIAYLNIERKHSEKIIKKYILKVPTFWIGLKNTLYDKKMLSGQLDVVLNEFDNGIILCDDKGFVILSNNKASEILNISREFQECIGDSPQCTKDLSILLSKDEISDEIIDFRNKKLVVTMKKVVYDDVYFGKLIILKYYNELLIKQQELHNKLIGKGYYSKYNFDSIKGSHPKLMDAIQISKKVANSSSTVLLIGESGTGKELFAGAIHNYSDRKYKPFIAINCATLPENLLESELFGYEEGSFTGARKGGKIGVFEKANHGTLFLDEIGEIPLNLQARLLRALQENEIMRIGGDSIINVDVRIIAASNKDLFKMVEQGAFRDDLFYRLNVFQVNLPPLREHKSDIEIMINYFLKEFKENRKIDASFTKFCQDYDWHGNIRELRNTIEYMIQVSKDSLKIENLPNYLKKKEILSFQSSIDMEMTVLDIIKSRENKGLGTGRRSIYEEFCKSYYRISEKEIRNIIKKLEEDGRITISVGRKGCRIAE
ncbi:sigma 54-interacting transcriptional regulator [Sedimentibacter sp. MB31-C6]|uniref:sigma 54-interacting transcriptional regulator n=1 Tax=Sedimentibacter sp. MB31-C6 TaxID=3109366 RepID=UPI002DDD7666|nr:sigma 54-interacting transcriptional regulator [Sedimentibacter sp. MB36-C1]WSI03547.1 sigma 54-interacting transcriptional regulator [Sedimentibacter sp. MB36-C1]